MKKTIFLAVACCALIGHGGMEAAAKALIATQSMDSQCKVEGQPLYTPYDHVLKDAKPDIETDFFLLMYSNSPGFCEHMKKKKKLDEVPFQCSSDNEFGWVIHGLWGESKSAYLNDEKDKHPRFCKGDLPALPLETIKSYLCMSPGTSLLQGEWEKHGACDFDSAEEYFNTTQELFGRFLVPPKELNAKKALYWMKENNPALKDTWLHLAGHEFGICFSTEFEVISCPKN